MNNTELSLEQLKAELEFHRKQVAEFRQLHVSFPSPRTRSAVSFHEQRVQRLAKLVRDLEAL